MNYELVDICLCYFVPDTFSNIIKFNKALINKSTNTASYTIKSLGKIGLWDAEMFLSG